MLSCSRMHAPNYYIHTPKLTSLSFFCLCMQTPTGVCCKWNLSISLRSFTGTSPPHLPAVCPARRSFVQYCTFIEHFPLRAGIASFQVLEVFRLGYIQAPWYRAIITLQWQHHILNIHHLTTSPRKTVCTQRRTTPTQAHEPNQH